MSFDVIVHALKLGGIVLGLFISILIIIGLVLFLLDHNPKLLQALIFAGIILSPILFGLILANWHRKNL